MNKSELVTTTVKFTKEAKLLLLSLAIKEGVSVSDVIRRSVNKEIIHCSAKKIFNIF